MDRSIYFLVGLLFFGCSKPNLTLHEGYALGTSFLIQYESNHNDFEKVQAGIDSVFYIINKSLSTYLPLSDISKVNNGDSLLVVDEHFKKVFLKADEQSFNKERKSCQSRKY